MSENLEGLSRPELVHIAAETGIPEANKMTKVELLEALRPQEDDREIELATDNVPPEETIVEASEAPQESTEASEPAPDYYPSPYGRRVIQKAVLYTDGLSGAADLNHERAYEYNERLQSNNPVERESGDESLSEAAKAQKSEEENREAAHVTRGNRQ